MSAFPAARAAWLLSVMLALACLPSPGAAGERGDGDVGYIVTPPEVVDAMLAMAEVGPADIVYDLGSGDGRIPIAAVRDFGAREAIGIEIDPGLVALSREKAERAGVAGRTRFIEGDIFETDFSDASVVTMYLFPQINRELRPRILSRLEPGTRVVSHEFGMGQWKPDAQRTVGDSEIHLWRVPAEVAGEWQWRIEGTTYRLVLRQRFQEVLGELRVGGERSLFRGGRLRGRDLRIDTALPGGTGDIAIDARALDDRLRGTATLGGTTHEFTAVKVE